MCALYCRVIPPAPQILAVLFETYVFIYLGMSLFTISQAWETMVMAIYATVICLLARLCNIYPISWMLNKYGGCDIDARKQFTMWFAGNINNDLMQIKIS